ncbi:hypothetical protein [Gandjariella thermophila]|uniref:Uncharacterized protein n=1 Tax=Gandjariella thermophila TaxID=1931992 RepID=A0A4D4IZE0_9PSEU|nr:hypothetical protein [Gandjariella thermophila]GDY28474.1 hypothetical protein GTS_01070 [Gandjariella thermophila]
MTTVVFSYVLYLLLSVLLTAWVGRMLTRHGRVYLAEVFRGDERLAAALNQLLVIGFYLVNLGFIALWLHIDQRVVDVRGVFETLSLKLGIVLLVIGALHMVNLWIFARIRHNALLRTQLTGSPRQTG